MPDEIFLKRLATDLEEADKAIVIAEEEITLAERAGVDIKEQKENNAAGSSKARSRFMENIVVFLVWLINNNLFINIIIYYFYIFVYVALMVATR